MRLSAVRGLAECSLCWLSPQVTQAWASSGTARLPPGAWR